LTFDSVARELEELGPGVAVAAVECAGAGAVAVAVAVVEEWWVQLMASFASGDSKDGRNRPKYLKTAACLPAWEPPAAAIAAD
jgi:hypothetical protein